jgi:hypothetical protein
MGIGKIMQFFPQAAGLSAREDALLFIEIHNYSHLQLG